MITSPEVPNDCGLFLQTQWFLPRECGGFCPRCAFTRIEGSVRQLPFKTYMRSTANTHSRILPGLWRTLAKLPFVFHKTRHGTCLILRYCINCTLHRQFVLHFIVATTDGRRRHQMTALCSLYICSRFLCSLTLWDYRRREPHSACTGY